MISQYSVKNSQRTYMHLYRWETNLKNRALASTTTHKYQFPLLHYFGMQRINLEVSLVHFPKSFPRLVLSSQPSMMCRDDRRHLHYGCYVRPFSNSLRHFVTCRTLVTSSSYTFINRQRTSRKKTRVTHKKRITVGTVPLRRTKSLHCYQLTPKEQHI